MKSSFFFVALGASLLFHAALVLPIAPIHFLLQKPDIKVNQQQEKAQIEILQFYPENYFEADLPQEFPLEISEGLGWKKKISKPFIQDEITYASTIRDLIFAELSMPSGVKTEEFEVRVAFVLNSKGELIELSIFKDSHLRSQVVHEAVLMAVKRASSHFPPFPNAVTKSEQRFSFLLVFNAS